MEFVIVSKDKEGTVLFEGKANEKEASFLLNIGINFLLAQGTYPLLKGESGNESVRGKVVDDDEKEGQTLQ